MLINDDRLNELMSKTIRPKCEPEIKVTFYTQDGEWVSKTFTSANVSSVKYKRGVDPVGRTLPYMELVWTETYLGNLSAENVELKYGMFDTLSHVSFALEQFTDFAGSDSIHFYTPPLWLVGKPVVNGHEIVWTARDTMYFLNNKQEIGFQKGINFRNPLRYFLLDERAEHKSNDYDSRFIYYLDRTQGALVNDNENLTDAIYVFDGTTKNILKDLASTRNYFWDFGRNEMFFKSFSDLLSKTDVVHTFKGDTMKRYPELTENKNISAFTFTQHKAKVKTKDAYTLDTPDEVIEDMGVSVNRYDLKDWVTITGSDGGSYLPNTINKVVYTSSNTKSVDISPVSINSNEMFVNNNKNGEMYSENNSCYFADKFAKLITRMGLLNKYFNEDIYTMQFECLPHFAVEPCDLVGVQTNIFENGERVIKKGIVVEQELSYNGAWTEKLIVHEVKANGAV